MFCRRKETRFAHIRDGTANVIMLSEILTGDDDDGYFTLERDFSRQLPGGFDLFPTAAQVESAGVTCDGIAPGDHRSNPGADWGAGFLGYSVFNTVAVPNWEACYLLRRRRLWIRL